MKRLGLLLTMAVALSSCATMPRTHEHYPHRDRKRGQYERPVGGDRDRHGCLPSAGYTWSVLYNDCVRLFEDGIRLNPVSYRRNEAVISAFVLMGRGKHQAELFLPDKKKSVLLERTRDGVIYKKGKYLYDARRRELYVNNKLKYSHR